MYTYCVYAHQNVQCMVIDVLYMYMYMYVLMQIHLLYSCLTTCMLVVDWVHVHGYSDGGVASTCTCIHVHMLLYVVLSGIAVTCIYMYMYS